METALDTVHRMTEIDELYANKQVALANSLIQAREKTSLFESKIEFLAIYKVGDQMNVHKKTDTAGKEYSVHFVEISSKEIKGLLGEKANKGSMYSYIEAAALELKRKLFVYRDRDSEQFVMSSLYGDVAYKSGRLTIEFNPDTEHLFLDLKDNYSKIRLDIAFKFQTNGGFQLYKLLKSMSYSIPEPDLSLNQEDFPAMQKEFSLGELRLQLGFVDLNQPEIQKESQKAYPDADRLFEIEKKPKYKRWNDFYKRVLDPGMNEINEISDIYIESIEKICTAHGRVDGAVIKLQRNREYYLRNQKEQKNTSLSSPTSAMTLTEEQMDEFIDEMRRLIKENLPTKDLRAIAKAAHYEMDKIKGAYEIAEKAGTIGNLTGWMISAINRGFSAPKKKSKDNYNSFKTTRDYDFDEIERDLQNKRVVR